MIEMEMIIINEIIVHHNAVEVVVDQKKFPVEIKIEDDHDQGKTNIKDKSQICCFFSTDQDIVHQNNLHVLIDHHVHVHEIDDVINVLDHGKYQRLCIPT